MVDDINFLKDDIKIKSFLNDYEKLFIDLINDNGVHESYKKHIADSQYKTEKYIGVTQMSDDISNKHLVSEGLLEKIYNDYVIKSKIDVNKSKIYSFDNKLEEYKLWTSEFKKLYKQNAEDGFNWAVDVQFMSLFDWKEVKDKRFNFSKIFKTPLDVRPVYYFQMKKMIPLIQNHFPERIVNLLSGYWYRPGDYMGWHHNNNVKGTMIYFTYSDKTNKSFFRYKDSNGYINTSFDKRGWNIRMFELTDKDFYYHCIYSDCNRMSFGFNVEGEK